VSGALSQFNWSFKKEGFPRLKDNGLISNFNLFISVVYLLI
jgi:hypothetical protein